ncbi:50S ribosomal protein L13 [Candidatus Pacearchaeota archaeon]|nr:50S ribosomal protein L13 [Candidatus Pacearchaeota archaeon]
MAKIIYDGKGAVFGRMASVITKDLLKGNFVDVINCEEIIISGKKEFFIEKVQAKRKMGVGSSLKGPLYIRKEDRLVKRMIRGMLPRDVAKGREAFKRLMCHMGNGNLTEEELKDVKEFKHMKPMKCFTIKKIVERLK